MPDNFEEMDDQDDSDDEITEVNISLPLNSENINNLASNIQG